MIEALEVEVTTFGLDCTALHLTQRVFHIGYKGKWKNH
jgi:hypothetical protein